MAKRFEFETAMNRLEDIVARLEEGSASLDEGLKLFEEGTTLIRQCGSALDKAEQKLKILSVGPEGPEELPFEAEE